MVSAYMFICMCMHILDDILLIAGMVCVGSTYCVCIAMLYSLILCVFVLVIGWLLLVNFWDFTLGLLC